MIKNDREHEWVEQANEQSVFWVESQKFGSRYNIRRSHNWHLTETIRIAPQKTSYFFLNRPLKFTFVVSFAKLKTSERTAANQFVSGQIFSFINEREKKNVRDNFYFLFYASLTAPL